MRCPKCDNRVLQKSGERIRLRTDGPIVFEAGVCKARCYWCKAEIEIPITIKKGAKIESEHLVILRRDNLS